MGIKEKLANAKKTRWLTDEEIDQIIKEARETAEKVKNNLDEAEKKIHN